VSTYAKQLEVSVTQQKLPDPSASNDDNLPEEILRIVDALARAAARRDHATLTTRSNTL